MYIHNEAPSTQMPAVIITASQNLKSPALCTPRSPKPDHIEHHTRFSISARRFAACQHVARRLVSISALQLSHAQVLADWLTRRRSRRAEKRRRSRSVLTSFFMRRGGDSNPRRRDYRRNGFRDRRIQPLCHLSVAECIHLVPPLQPHLPHLQSYPTTLYLDLWFILIARSSRYPTTNPDQQSLRSRGELARKQYRLEVL